MTANQQGNTQTQGLVGRLGDSTQEFHVAPSVLLHMASYRQRTPWATEAGGQIFGTVEENKISVLAVSGPYRGDERFRNRYRSNSRAAQQAVDDKSREGLLYLGEWHTHAEDYPSVSGIDIDAMSRLMASSTLNTNGLFMAIAGRSRTLDGIRFWHIFNGAATRVDLVHVPVKLVTVSARTDRS